MTSILSLSGSARTGSFNRQTAHAFASYLRQQDAAVTDIDLRDYPAPLYDGDLEAQNGLPEGIQRLKQALKDHDGLVISCPEYNGFMTPLLLNSIDWATRSDDAGLDLSCFRDKPVLVLSASPGPGGGGRAAVHLRTLLGGIGALNFPDTLVVGGAHQAFSDSGEFADERMAQRAADVAGRFVQFVRRQQQ